MADFVEVMKIKSRMCHSINCGYCPINIHNNGKGILCGPYLCDYPEQAQEIILKWDKEHPIKTKWDKLVEIFGAEMAETLKITPDDVPKWFDEYKEPEVK